MQKFNKLEDSILQCKTQLNDALIESYAAYWLIGSSTIPGAKMKAQASAHKHVFEESSGRGPWLFSG
jgi:hypothetical protein